MMKLAPSNEASNKMNKMILATIPIGRLGKTWDIGMAAVFLRSQAGSFISGDTLVVDGASWMMKPPAVPRQQVSMLSRGIEKKSRDLKATSKL